MRQTEVSDDDSEKVSNDDSEKVSDNGWRALAGLTALTTVH
jgi:hypothetical protein